MSPKRPIFRTYLGKRPSLYPANPPKPIVTSEDPFDRLVFGEHRAQPHVFSSSSDATLDASASDQQGLNESFNTSRKFFKFYTGERNRVVKKRRPKKRNDRNVFTLPASQKKLITSLGKLKKGTPIPICTSTPTKSSELDECLARLCANLHIKTPSLPLNKFEKSSPFKKKLSMSGSALDKLPESHSSHMEGHSSVQADVSNNDAPIEVKSSPDSSYKSLHRTVSPENPSLPPPITPDIPSLGTPESLLDFRGFSPGEFVNVRRRRLVTDFRSPESTTSEEDSLSEDTIDVGEDSRVNVPLLRASLLPLYSLQEQRLLEPLQEYCEENMEMLEDGSSNLSSRQSSPAETPNMRRKTSRHSEERSPTGRSSIARAITTPGLNSVIEVEESDSEHASNSLDRVVFPTGKRLRRSISIIRGFDNDRGFTSKGQRFSESVNELIELQKRSLGPRAQEMPAEAVRKSLSVRRMSWMKQQCTPSARRRSHRQLDLHDNRRLSLSNVDQVITPATEEFRSKILLLCNQKEPCSFDEVLNKEAYEGARKLGEGVFGEVFSITRNNTSSVLKIMPVEGTEKVNGETQKTFAEIYTEMLITQQLSLLRNGGDNSTSGFVQVSQMKLVRGRYPDKLVELWRRYDDEKGSENDEPSMFSDIQLFVVIEQANGGTDLESYGFSTANQAFPVFQQIVYSLAVAEKSLQFEHRDLHVGNVLISRSKESSISFVIDGKEHFVRPNGVKATIIDYSLSRMTFDGNQYFCDLSKDPELFIGEGDIQFDVYRYMKKDVGNEWERFNPKTNVRWLQYLLKKLVRASYQRTNANVHKQKIQSLEKIGDWMISCGDAVEIAERLIQDR